MSNEPKRKDGKQAELPHRLVSLLMTCMSLFWVPSVFALPPESMGFRIGYLTVTNRDPNAITTPLYIEGNYHIPLVNNDGYEMVAQLAHSNYSYQKRERTELFRHDDHTTLAQLSFTNNERDGFEFYWGAGGGVGYYYRRSKVIEGDLKGQKSPITDGVFISFHGTIGVGWYTGSTGFALEGDWANWGGLFVSIASFSMTF